MAQVHVEVEAKYDADEGVEVPSLVEVFGPGLDDADGPWAEGEAATHELDATYYDTADLALAAAHLTLRRRTGGEDAGWHLKVPMPDGSRSEVRLDLTDGAAVPEPLVAMTWARTLGRLLVPVARVENHRSVRHLVDATGRVLVEVADDRVTARRLHHSDAPGDVVGAEQRWREVEVEVVDGPRELLAAAEPRLRQAGLRPAAIGSKLARTLGTATEPAEPPALTAQSPAGDVVLAWLRAHVEQLRAQDLPVRLDAPDGVHQMRVATRRLRSALRTFQPLLRRRATRPLRDELRWLAGVLGAVRDAEVLRDRVVGAALEADDDLREAVADDVADRLGRTHREARDALLEALDGERYRTLLRGLADLVSDPPRTSRASRTAGRALPRLVARADDDVRATVRDARQGADAARRHEERHAARKAAKRARYAGEAVAVALGDDAAAYAAAMEAVQDVLGEHLDAVGTAGRLADLGAGAPSPAAFAYGRLQAAEAARADRALGELDAAWATARRKRLRRWLG